MAVRTSKGARAGSTQYRAKVREQQQQEAARQARDQQLYQQAIEERDAAQALEPTTLSDPGSVDSRVAGRISSGEMLTDSLGYGSPDEYALPQHLREGYANYSTRKAEVNSKDYGPRKGRATQNYNLDNKKKRLDADARAYQLAAWQADHPGQIDVSDNPDTNLRRVMQAKEREYQEMYRPLGKGMLDSIDPTSEDAYKAELFAANRASQLNSRADQALARAKRQQHRLNAFVDPLSEREGAYETRQVLARRGIGNINNAIATDWERNNRVRDSMINVGRGISSSSLNNLTGAAQSQNAVENQNEQLDAQNRAAQQQFALGLVGTFI